MCVLRERAAQHPDAFDAFTATQPRAECPLAWQPVNFFPAALASGFLLGGLGRLAACCRFMGARRGGALWGQRAGLSLCEAVVRERCGRLDAADPTRAAQIRLCASAGGRLLRLTSPLPVAPRVCERTVEGHTGWVWALAACAGGKLASGSCDSTIKIWDVATGQCERTLEGHTSYVWALAACAGDKLASGSWDKTIKVWDVATGQCERTLRSHTGRVHALAACAGCKLASGSWGKTIKIWSAHDQEGRSDGGAAVMGLG